MSVYRSSCAFSHLRIREVILNVGCKVATKSLAASSHRGNGIDILGKVVELLMGIERCFQFYAHPII